MVGEAEVDALFQSGVDVGIGGGGRMAGEVCGSADQGAAELVEQLLAEVELGYAYTNSAVDSEEIMGKRDCEHSCRQDDRGGTRAVEEQLSGLGWDVGREHRLLGKDKHGLAMVALFDGVDAFYGVGVGGIATDAP